ncbi:MAG: sugar O-acetyltransferase [Oscillospiraceae bacterium]|nr:sugar O-acetyltransferase [Oscillospiraceae bacterium]
MELNEFLQYIKSGRVIKGGSEAHNLMHRYSQEAMKITTEINSVYHNKGDLRKLFSELIGKNVPEDFGLHTPFHTDFGKNITIGKRVFINSGCTFQDQGGITVGDGALIGHNVVIATLNHAMNPSDRADMIPSPVTIGENVWIGSNSTILPGVTIGDGAVIGGGSVVTKDIPPCAVAVGNPARVIKYVD